MEDGTTDIYTPDKNYLPVNSNRNIVAKSQHKNKSVK